MRRTLAASFSRYSAQDLDFLAESAAKLAPYTGAIVEAWTDELVGALESPLRTSVEKLFEVNHHLLERYLTNLRERELDRVVEESLEAVMALLEFERDLPPGERSTLAHLHLSLEIGSARVFERVRDLFRKDARLPAFLALHNRLSLELA